MPANTGEAGAMYRVAFFAGEPAPTGIAVNFSFAQSLWERL
ncbi:sensory box protein [Pseudomonas putida]|nr:sensory box protein [Pseudomonas putida]AJG15966.1 sensory box protein/GGDEF family protein [Pseudomonas plecoglossicida]